MSGRAFDQNPPTPPGVLFELERRAARWWHPLVLLAVLAALYFLGEAMGLRDELRRLERWMNAVGPLGPVLFVFFYVVVTVLGFPGSPLTAAAGALFGGWGGTAVSLVASTAAATISFLIARHLTPARLRRRLVATRSFQHLDGLARRRGPLVVLATRLVNLLPFAVVNYGFGLTGIRLRTYVLWSILGKIPGTVVLVVGVDLVAEAIQYRRVSWSQAGLVLAVALTLGLVVRRIRLWLRDDTAEA